MASHRARAASYYTNLLEQGLRKADAGEHTRLRFGLTPEQVRDIMAHEFVLELDHDGVLDAADVDETRLTEVMQQYANLEHLRSRGYFDRTLDDANGDDVPYFGD